MTNVKLAVLFDSLFGGSVNVIEEEDRTFIKLEVTGCTNAGLGRGKCSRIPIDKLRK